MRENEVEHAMKMGVFDSSGVISMHEKFWGVFFGKKSTNFDPHHILKPLHAKDAYKRNFFHFLKVIFYENVNFKGVFGVFDQDVCQHRLIDASKASLRTLF